MVHTRNHTSSDFVPTPSTTSEVVAPLRVVVLAHADQCFRDTDGITRDAARMVQIMESWHPKRSDGQAGVRRNGAFDPDLPVTVQDDTRICYPHAVEHRGQPTLLFTIVAPDAARQTAPHPSTSRQ